MSDAQPRERKRRKWDVTADGSTAPAPRPATTPVPGASVQAAAAAAAAMFPGSASGNAPNALPTAVAPAVDPSAVAEGAAAVVQKINADLVARGLLPASKLGLGPKLDLVKEIAREVTINDAPPGIRHQLTRRQCQEDIQRKTHTVLSVRGRYFAPGAPQDDAEKPLHLRIIPASTAGETDEEKQKAVDAAAGEVQAILQGIRGGVPRGQNRQAPPQSYGAVPPPGTQPGLQPIQGPAGAPCTTKVYVGFSVPPAFRLEARLTGPSGSYLAHIQRETGSTVELRGRNGAGPSEEHLHLFLAAQTPKALEDARGLAKNLIDTTRAAADKECPGQITVQHTPNPPAPTPAYHQPPPSQYHRPPGHPQYPHHQPPPHPGYQQPPPPGYGYGYGYPPHSQPPGPAPPRGPAPPPQPSQPGPPSYNQAPPPYQQMPPPGPASEPTAAKPEPVPKRRFSEGPAAEYSASASAGAMAPPPPKSMSMPPPPPKAGMGPPQPPTAAPPVESFVGVGGQKAGIVDYSDED